MSIISKQALIVDNNQSFPDNNSGAITPTDLRSFNTNMIDSLVDEITYVEFTASVNNSISSLNTFTASQQPSFTNLNAFTASQLSINTGLNAATYSLNVGLNSVVSEVDQLQTWSGSVNQISDNGIVQGYSTRLHFYGLVSASIVPNVAGAIASINIEQDGTKLDSSSFNSYTASTDNRLNNIETWSGSAKISISALNAYTQSVGPAATGSLLLTSSFADDKLTFTKGNGNTYTNAGIQQTASFNQFSSSINAFTASNGNTSLNTFTASIAGTNAWTASTNTTLNTLNAYTASNNTKWNTIGLLTGSYATTGSNTFVNTQTITGSASKVLVGNWASTATYPTASIVASNVPFISDVENHNIGIVGAATASANGSTTIGWGVGGYFKGWTNGGVRSAGVVGEGMVSASADAGSSIGVRGYAQQTHAGGLNIGLYGHAISGSSNYALYMNSGDIFSNIAQNWTLVSSTNALNIQSGLFNIDTTNKNIIASGSSTITGSLIVTGSVVTTGSVLGNISTLTIASQTASMDLSKGNFFTLTLANGVNTHIVATNVKAGQTINLLVTQGSPAGTVTFNPQFKWGTSFAYSASAVVNSKDLVSLVTFDTSSIYGAAIKNLA